MAELCKMAVSPKVRGQGLGNLLVKELDNFCSETGVLHVSLSTANLRAGNFYQKCGFVDLMPEGSEVMRMTKYYGERVIRKVAIVGGTHGNERIGVELIRQWAIDGNALKRSTFETSVLIGNPIATKANIRYQKADMNRQFAEKDIENWQATSSIETKAGDDNSIEVEIVEEEVLQARKLNEILGPKGVINGVHNSDFIIDLHSSISNVGLMGMINGAGRDCHAVRLSQYLLESRKEDFPDLRITTSKSNKNDAPNVDSISPYGIAFEVGPISHGTISFNLLEKTRKLVYASLDFIEQQNMKLLHAASQNLEVEISDTTSSTTSSTSFTTVNGVIRSQDRDIVLANTPETRELICKIPPFSNIKTYVEVSKVHYPTNNTQGKEGKGEGKEENENVHEFPTSTCIHPSLEGKYWK